MDFDYDWNVDDWDSADWSEYWEDVASEEEEDK